MANTQNIVSLRHLRNISREERDREIAYNVSTELTLSIDPGIWKSDLGGLVVNHGHLMNISNEIRDVEIADRDIWKIKKTLTTSDVTAQTRLLIPKKSVYEHIFKYLTKEVIRLIEDEDNEGLRITVFDSDTGSTHQLSFTKWNSSGSYVLKNNWNKEFVQRRNLEKGQTIGLFWNSDVSRLHFRVFD